jgi:hypothetical protein
MAMIATPMANFARIGSTAISERRYSIMAIIRLSHEQFEDGFEWPLFFLAALQAALVGQLAQFKLEPSLITLSSQTTFDDAEVWLSIRDCLA